MKRVLNIVLSILLSVVVFLAIFCITILNKNYIKYELKKYDYYNQAISSIKSEINGEIIINYDDIKNDIDNYVDSYYEDKIYYSKINSENDYKDIYNKYVRFIGPFNNIRLYRDIMDICILIFIILTGLLFLKTKFKHDINIILLISGGLGIIISFIVYMNNNYNNLLYNFIKDAYYVYLGINILLLMLPIIGIVFKRLRK